MYSTSTVSIIICTVAKFLSKSENYWSRVPIRLSLYRNLYSTLTEENILPCDLLNTSASLASSGKLFTLSFALGHRKKKNERRQRLHRQAKGKCTNRTIIALLVVIANQREAKKKTICPCLQAPDKQDLPTEHYCCCRCCDFCYYC